MTETGFSTLKSSMPTCLSALPQRSQLSNYLHWYAILFAPQLCQYPSVEVYCNINYSSFTCYSRKCCIQCCMHWIFNQIGQFQQNKILLFQELVLVSFSKLQLKSRKEQCSARPCDYYYDICYNLACTAFYTLPSDKSDN